MFNDVLYIGSPRARIKMSKEQKKKSKEQTTVDSEHARKLEAPTLCTAENMSITELTLCTSVPLVPWFCTYRWQPTWIL